MTAFVLKIIALTCMGIDHLGAVFPMYFPIFFRVIGRVSFPIYVYLIAEGCRHTRSMPKYMARLAVFALVSQIPFDLAFNQTYDGALHISFIHDTNIFYTLLLGTLGIYAYQKLRVLNATYAPYLAALPLVILMGLAEWLQTDYGGYGVAFIVCLYAVPKKTPRLWLMALLCCYEFYQVWLGALEVVLGVRLPFGELPYALYFNETGLWMLAGCLASVPLAAWYNGRRGPSLKWFFYAAYPLHLLILGVVWLWWVRPALMG